MNEQKNNNIIRNDMEGVYNIQDIEKRSSVLITHFFEKFKTKANSEIKFNSIYNAGTTIAVNRSNQFIQNLASGLYFNDITPRNCANMMYAVNMYTSENYKIINMCAPVLCIHPNNKISWLKMVVNVMPKFNILFGMGRI
jgi:hypothetical protein